MSASSSIRAMRFIVPGCASARGVACPSLPLVTTDLIVSLSLPGGPGLAEPSGDVVLSDLLTGIGEDLLGAVVLHEPTQHEERRELADARRLLHVVRHDDDGEVHLQLVDELLDLGR